MEFIQAITTVFIGLIGGSLITLGIELAILQNRFARVAIAVGTMWFIVAIYIAFLLIK